MRRLSRRSFLGISLAGVLGLLGFYAYENRYRDLIVEVIEDKLSYLNLSQVDLYAFADEFARDRGTYGGRGNLLALAYPVLERASFLNFKRDAVDEFEHKVVSRFLLSTDFFSNEADESRAIQYVAYNNPYRRACGNPFARFE